MAVPSQNSLLFEALLKTGLIPQRGATPTFTRASPATVTDFEGNARTCLANEARFQGMRRVQNLVAYSENLANAIWVKSNVTPTYNVTDPVNGVTALTITATGDAGEIYQTLTGRVIGTQHTGSWWIRRRTGSGVVKMYANTASSDITSQISNTWQRISVSSSATSTTIYSGINIATAGDSVDIWHPQLENVTNQSVQTPGDYVSTGVLSYPYQGAGVDGVQYFSTKLDGTAIIGGGYLNEPARTNLLLTSAVPATQSITTTAQNYTVSFYGTGSCTLTGMASGTLNGTGVNNRVSLTVAATAGVVLATFSGSTTNGQFENGPNMSSYIATTGSTASRAADYLAYSIPNLPQKNFTIAAEIMKPQLSVTNSNGADAPIQIGGYSVNASMTLGGYYLGLDTALGAWPTAWNLVSAASISPYVAGVSTKSAWAFDNDGITLRSAFSGALVTARTANAAKASNWVSNNIGIGSPPGGLSGSDAMPFVISNVRLYNKVLPDATLQAL